MWFLVLLLGTLVNGEAGRESQCIKQWNEETGSLDIWVFLACPPSSNSSLSARAVKRRAMHGSIVDAQVDMTQVEQIVGFGVRLRTVSNWLCAISVRVHTKVQLSSIVQLPFVTKLVCVAKAPSPRQPDSLEPLDAAILGDTNKRFPIPDSPYGHLDKAIKSMDIHTVHEQGFNGKGILIMVADAGFQTNHECLSHAKVMDQYDFVDDDNDVTGTTTQTKHGTATLSLVVGKKEGTFVGVAPEATVLLAKTESLEYEELIEEDFFVRAIEWGEAKGVNLISSSLGYNSFWQFVDYDGKTSVASLAVEMAFHRGVVVVMSVGNYGLRSLATPADSRGALSVGSISDNGLRSKFSSVGPTSDGRIKPDVVGPGEAITLADSGSQTAYYKNSGTSFSSPFVAGIAALIMQAHPDWTSDQVVEAIRRSSSNTEDPNIELGWGFVNALRAIEYEPAFQLVPQNCENFCKNGECSTSGVCICDETHYGIDCSFSYVKCEVWCTHKCYQNKCYCDTPMKAKCVNETLPGWSCPNSKYADGTTCNFCNQKDTLQDPDCFGYSADDCEGYEIPISNLSRHCNKPTEIITHEAMQDKIEDSASEKVFIFSGIVGTVVLLCVCFAFYLRKRRTSVSNKQYI